MDIEKLFNRIADNINITPEQGANKIIAKLTPKQIKALALACAADRIERLRRNKQLDVELRNSQTILIHSEERAKQYKIRQQQEQEKQKQEREVRDKFYEELYVHPELLYGTAKQKRVLEQKLDVKSSSFLNRVERIGFKGFCIAKNPKIKTTNDEGLTVYKSNYRAFEKWYEKALKIAARTDTIEPKEFPTRVDDCQIDWEGMYTVFHKRQMERMQQVIEIVATETELRVTKELLGSQFALGDGRITTWGKATIAEHQQRILLLKKNATANVEAAARHKAAIKLLKKNKIRSLSQLTTRLRKAS